MKKNHLLYCKMQYTVLICIHVYVILYLLIYVFPFSIICRGRAIYLVFMVCLLLSLPRCCFFLGNINTVQSRVYCAQCAVCICTLMRLLFRQKSLLLPATWIQKDDKKRFFDCALGWSVEIFFDRTEQGN